MMSQTVSTIPSHACRRIVQALIAQYDWALSSEADLVKQVLDTVPPDASPDEMRREAIHHYTTVLYEACRQDEDPHRREQAYRELHRYLYRAAHNRWPELAEDATQRALVLVYEQIECCREPGAFLAFALWKLRHAVQQEQQARSQSLERIGHGVEGEPAVTTDPLAHRERVRVLTAAIGRIPDERKRETIVLKYVAGWSDEEIGARLEVTASYVRVLRHRGISRLREDEQLRSYFDVEDEGQEI